MVTKSTTGIDSLGERVECSKLHQFILQSEDIDDTEVPSLQQAGPGEISEQTVTFLDNEGGVVLDAPLTENHVALTDGTEDISLGSFLSRPTLIDTRTWLTTNVQGQLGGVINPWRAFLADTRINNKIQNYAFLRARLHIKIVVNGTPFQFGQLRIAYRPLLDVSAEKFRTGNTPGKELVTVSQYPGFYIYPQANAGGEMTLPFLYHKSWMNITVNSDVVNMGELRYWVYYPLDVAVSGGSTSVTLRMYAWMTDVNLMGSTTKFSLQSDEYGNGPVSRPASALAKLASNLSHIPVIGRFARATEIGASAVSSIATLFGFTNVPVIDNVAPMQPMNAPHLASAQIGTPIQKLTLDPKQELSIDPSPHGIGSADELALNYLKIKESFFGYTTWNTTDINGTCLFSTNITPLICDQESVLSAASAVVGQRVWHTPLSWLASMFENWRGDIIIRMKVVCTKFHKGRLKVSYDPVSPITGVDAPENAVYTEILDIGESDDIEIRIPYHQATSWLRIGEALNNKWAVGTGAPAPNVLTDNGQITVRVLTNLTAPVSGQVGLLFYVRAAENFEFANPSDKIKGLSASTGQYKTPSFFQLQAEDTTDVTTTTIAMGPPAQVYPERYGLNYGEAVSSLRNLAHRAAVSDTVQFVSSSATGVAQYLYKNYMRMPYTPGYSFSTSLGTLAQTVVAAASTYSYNFCDMHHLPYIASPFIGYRGGVNIYVTPSTDQYGFVDDIRVYRITDTTAVSASATYGTYGAVLPYAATASQSAFFHGVNAPIRNGFSGNAITSNRTNASLCFNLPDFNYFNFGGITPATYAFGSSSTGTNYQAARLGICVKNRSATDQNGQNTISVCSEYGAGPDWTCLYFQGVPTMDYIRNDPVPV